MNVEVPELVRQRAMANGSAGERWLADLPEVVADLAHRWNLTIGPTLHGGTAAYVATARRVDRYTARRAGNNTARRADRYPTRRAESDTARSSGGGEDCVLKVAMPLEIDGQDSFAHSVLVHRLAAGRGCALLYEADPEVPAMLLERLGPNLDDLGHPVPTMLDIISNTFQAFWRTPPADCPLRTGVDQAAWLSNFITSSWDDLGRPCHRAVIDRALDYCQRRADAFDRSRAVIVHGDGHGWNTLQATRGEHKFVDPEGLISERAHDLAVPMREYNRPFLIGPSGRHEPSQTAALVRQRAAALAEPSGVDPESVWQWGFIERVSTGLANLADFDDPEDGDMFLEVAARCLQPC